MPIAKDFTVKRLADAVVGELVSFSFAGKDAFALPLAVLNDGRVHYGVLGGHSSDELPPVPFHTAFEPDEYCLSFGTDWELELIRGAETFSRNREFHDRPGAFHVTEAQVILHFSRPPDQIRVSALNYDVVAWSRSDIPNHAAPILQWKIWARPGMSIDPNAQPIFSFRVGRAGP